MASNTCGFVTYGKIFSSPVDLATRRKKPMKTPKIKREIVAAFMKSPLYFTIPLDKRLVLIKFFSQPTVYNNCKLDRPTRKGRKDFQPASLDKMSVR